MKKPQKKPTIGSAISASIGAEEESVSRRFEKAETLLNPQKPQESSPPKEGTKKQPKEKKSIPKKQLLPEKVVRDTFTMPPKDYKRISDIQHEALQSAIQVNKSEIIRAGLISLQKLTENQRNQILLSLEKVKPGRPAG